MPSRSPFVPFSPEGKIFSNSTLEPFTKVLAIEWIMIVVTLALVALRLYIRVYCQRQRSWSDVLVFAGWVFFFTQGCMDIESNRLGAFKPHILSVEPRWKIGKLIVKHDDAVKVLKIQYFSEFTYLWTMYAMKGSMLVFLYGLVPRSTLKKTWITLNITIGFTAIGFIVSMALGLLYCHPIAGNWSITEKGFCDSIANPVSGSVAVSFHIISDLMIYIVPFPVLHLLVLSKLQKFGVGCIFALGFFCIGLAMTVIAVVATTGWSNIAIVCCILEQGWSILVVCAPAFRIFLTRSRQHFFCKHGSSKGSHGHQYHHQQHVNGGVGASQSEDAELGLARRVSIGMGRILKRSDDDIIELIPEGPPRVIIRGVPVPHYPHVYAHAAGSISTISKNIDDIKEEEEPKDSVIFAIKE